MKKHFILWLAILLFTGCNFEKPTQFTEKAYHDTLLSLRNKKSTFKNIINQYKGKKVLIDIWASWCADCIKGLPTINNLQKEFPEVVFLFISVDKNRNSWKNGIQRFNIKGAHYNLPKGMSNGDFVNFVNLRWIPRYMVVDELGNISLFKATKATDSDIIKALKRIK